MNFETIMSEIPPELVYALVALLIGVESIGIPLPGETALVAATLLTLHPDSQISPWLVALFAMTGAVIGDSIGYSVGSKYGSRLLVWFSTKFPKHFSPAHIRYAEHVFARWGTWAVFFGRFIALLRILAGPLAGALKISYRRFLVANMTGGFVWAFGTVWFIVSVGEAAHTYLREFAWIGFAVVFIGVTLAMRLLNARIQMNVKAFAALEEQQSHEPPTPAA